MRRVSADEANHDFSRILAQVEAGEAVLITNQGRPVAVLSPYRPPEMTPERAAAIEHAIVVMNEGLPWEGTEFPPFTRDEMHER